MEWRKVLAIVAIVVSACSTVVAYSGREAVMAVVSAIVVVVSLVSLAWGSMLSAKLAAISAVVTTTCSYISIHVLHHSGYMGMVSAPTLSWTLLVGLVHAVAIAPSTLAFLTTLASVAGSSFNWALVLVLGMFSGMGLELPAFALALSMIPDGSWVVDNSYVMFNIVVTLMVMAILSLCISYWMRRKGALVTADGLVMSG